MANTFNCAFHSLASNYIAADWRHLFIAFRKIMFVMAWLSSIVSWSRDKVYLRCVPITVLCLCVARLPALRFRSFIRFSRASWTSRAYGPTQFVNAPPRSSTTFINVHNTRNFGSTLAIPVACAMTQSPLSRLFYISSHGVTSTRWSFTKSQLLYSSRRRRASLADLGPICR
jgi:hypothetical protein